MSDIIFEKNAGVASITFNRPAVKNAMTMAMARDLTSILRDVRDDPGVRVLVFRGVGADFSAGGDMGDLKDALSENPEARRVNLSEGSREISRPMALALDAIQAPVVVSCRGHVVGIGAQLMLAADIVVASETTKLLIPMVKLAHAPDHGESYILPRKVGLGRAAQILLLAETVRAADAERYGLINYLTADADLEVRTAEVVERLARSPREAVRQTKALLKASLHRTYDEQLEAEAASTGACAAHPDYPEAITAFTERRKPVFA